MGIGWEFYRNSGFKTVIIMRRIWKRETQIARLWGAVEV